MRCPPASRAASAQARQVARAGCSCTGHPLAGGVGVTWPASHIHDFFFFFEFVPLMSLPSKLKLEAQITLINVPPTPPTTAQPLDPTCCWNTRRGFHPPTDGTAVLSWPGWAAAPVVIWTATCVLGSGLLGFSGQLRGSCKVWASDRPDARGHPPVACILWYRRGLASLSSGCSSKADKARPQGRRAAGLQGCRVACLVDVSTFHEIHLPSAAILRDPAPVVPVIREYWGIRTQK